MFSGIIDHCGTINAVVRLPNALRVTIDCHYTDIMAGESIAVDGICLTATASGSNQFSCDISPETLKLTTAGTFKSGQSVNLERALRMGDRIGGHWVMGHVDQKAVVKDKKIQEAFTELTINGIADDAMSYIIKKGSIAINGTSLTVNEVLKNGFQVMLIPHTLEITNLKHLSPGDSINLEFDWMSRVIINQLQELPLIKQLS